MTELLPNFKQNLKKILSYSLFVGILTQLATPLFAGTPRFNYLEGDHELFRGQNLTQHETDYSDPVTGDAGDNFQAIVYYHNGVVDTVAGNTTVQVTIPKETVNNRALMTASISADDAAMVTDTVVNGQIVGQSGLTTILSKNATIDFVPGSVRWFPNGGKEEATLPNNQSGDEIITSDGLNLGDIQGCWQYSGFVVFRYKTTPKEVPPVGELTIAKTVRNVTSGDNNFQEMVNAKESDQVEFKLDITNETDSALDSILLRDNLPYTLSYVNGSLQKSVAGGAYQNVSDTLAGQMFGAGWDLGRIEMGKNQNVSVKFKAVAPNAINNEATVVNTASVTNGNFFDEDTAKVKLVPTPIAEKNLTVSKMVKNVSQNQSDWTKQSNAKSEETLSFKIEIKNTGEADLKSVKVKDVLPFELGYTIDSLQKKLNDGAFTKIDLSDANMFFINGIDLGGLKKSETLILVFNTKAPSEINENKEIVNKVIVVADGLTKEDTATVCLVRAGESIIEKSKIAKNLDTGDEGQEIKAKAGQEILYVLTTKNTGSAKGEITVEDDIADIIELADVLNISDGGSLSSSNMIQWPTMEIAAGQTISLTFKVKIIDPLRAGTDLVMINFYGNQVKVTIEKEVIDLVTKLGIEKTVRNVTKEETKFVDENSAKPGDILEYKIDFKNAGNADADRIKFFDDNPSNTEYIGGTTVISRGGGDEKTLADGIVKDGIMLETIQAGEKGYIKFRVKISSTLDKELVLINTAKLVFGKLVIADTAKTSVKIGPKPAPTPTPTPAPTPTPGPSIPSLPKTGSGVAGFLITFIISALYLYMKDKKSTAFGWN